MPEPELDAAIQGLAATKAEHRPLITSIARDAGMSPDTRTELLEHLYQEEDEKVARIQAALSSPPGQAPPLRATPGLTVGSLRAPDRPPAPGPGTVGSLRT